MKISVLFLFCVMLPALIACSGENTNQVTGKTIVTGIASKGPIHGATVSVFSLDVSGIKGEMLAEPTLTSSDGSYSIELGDYSGNILIEIYGGSYTDEASNTLVTNSVTLRSALTNVSGNTIVQTTALTEIAVRVAENLGGLTANNIRDANALLGAVFTVNIIQVKPADVLAADAKSQSVASQAYGVALAGISQLLVLSDPTTPVSLDQALQFLASDLSDNNLFDSLNVVYADAISTFLNSQYNQSNPQASAGLLAEVNPSQTSPVEGGVDGGISPSIVENMVGDWYTIEFDDTQTNIVDDYASEIDGMRSITILSDGSWEISSENSSDVTPPDLVENNWQQLQVILHDDTGLSRTYLTYDLETDTIAGELQILNDSGFFIPRYDTWIMIKPTSCNTLGSAHSYAEFMSSVYECGTRQILSIEDIVTKTYSFSGSPDIEYVFSLEYSGFLRDKAGTYIDSFDWWVDVKGYLEIYIASDRVRKKIAWLDSDNEDLIVRVYGEDEINRQSNLVFDNKKDGEISEQRMVFVQVPLEQTVYGTWETGCPGTSSSASFITLNTDSSMETGQKHYTDANCTNVDPYYPLTGTFLLGEKVRLDDGSYANKIDLHITEQGGVALDITEYTVVQLDQYDANVMKLGPKYPTADERDANTASLYSSPPYHRQ
jgi:hypothetical protein